jgi:hypothetical protein
MRKWFLLAVLAAGLGYTAGWLVEGLTPTDTTGAPEVAARIAAAGDLACPPGGEITPVLCQQVATYQTAKEFDPDAVLLLGDVQYPTGSLGEFKGGLDRSWGKFGDKLHPAAGNHDWLTPAAKGYFEYFKQTPGADGQHPYSFDLKGWHIISLDTDCYWTVGCGPKSLQYRWLEQDLKAHPGQCTLAYYHHPVVTSGQFSLSDEQKAPAKYFFKLLNAYGADLVMNGHDHIYERFGHIGSNAKPDPNGVREIISGTGGRSHFMPFGIIDRVAGSEFIDIKHFGVTELQLNSGWYSWQFVDTAGKVLDSGSDTCHNAFF